MTRSAPLDFGYPHADNASFLQSAVANAPDAVVIAEIVDAGAIPRIVYVNAAFSRMTGYDAAEVLGKTPRILQGPRSSSTSRAKMRHAIAQRQAVTIDLINYRKDGSEYFVELSIAPIDDDSGMCTLWIAIARDITLRRRNEEQRTLRYLENESIARREEIEKRERAQEQLAFKAAHDDLTGLHNREYFVARLEAAVNRMRAEGTYCFSLLYFNINRFKLVNDHLGHSTGDRILCDLAKRFESLAAPSDTVARIGGDIFALLLDAPDSAEQAASVAQRMLMEIAHRPRAQNDDLVLSANIGIVASALYTSRTDADAMLRDAEIALGHSRRNGTAVAAFTPEMHAQNSASQETRNDLYGAVERGELRLFYQPLVDIAIGRIYGFEALVRWQHPVRGLIPPDAFIPIAEETGIIIELGRWVLLEGCRKARELQAVAGYPLKMSLNVSSQQLFHPRFFDHLEEALTVSQVDPHTLQVEITESIFLAGGAVAGTLLARIRALGIHIALDDFGTGYSSLSYLERFQVDTLKIDKSFVSRIHDASGKSEILRMIIALAHSLGVDVIAEGVETRAQRDALGQLGCTHLQGYLFSRPVPEAAAATILRADSGAHVELDALLQETLSGADATSLSSDQRAELLEQVDAAIQAHYTWIARLQHAAATGEAPFDIIQVAREDLCPIGVWLNTTICETLRSMPLYYVTKARHAVFHRSMARLLAAATARRPEAALALRPDGDVAIVAASLLQTLHDWRSIAAAGALRTCCG